MGELLGNTFFEKTNSFGQKQHPGWLDVRCGSGSGVTAGSVSSAGSVEVGLSGVFTLLSK